MKIFQLLKTAIKRIFLSKNFTNTVITAEISETHEVFSPTLCEVKKPISERKNLQNPEIPLSLDKYPYCSSKNITMSHSNETATLAESNWLTTIFWVFIGLFFTLSSLFSVLYGQNKFLETQAFTTGLSTASSSGNILESVAGEISGSTVAASGKKILSGHSSTSHSPGVMYDLIASTGTDIGEGMVKCRWTHVGLDGFVGIASSVELKIATFPVTYANYASITSFLTLTARSAGTTDQIIYSNLVPGPTYYVAMRVRDRANIYGRISPNTTFFTYALPPDPVDSLTLVSSTYGAITLLWNVTGDDGTSGDINPGFFRIDYSTHLGHSFSSATYMVQLSTIALAGSLHLYQISNLLGNVTYYASVYIGDDVTVYSGLGNIAQLVTMSYPPTQLGFSNISGNGFTVSWTGNNSPGTEYYIQVSSDSAFSYYVESGWVAASSASFSGLDTNQLYYVRGKSRNSAFVETQYADLGTISLTSNVAKPKPPALKGKVSGSKIVLSWLPVFYDIRGSTTTILYYEVYSSTGIDGPKTLLITVSSSVWTYETNLDPNVWYYVKARDIYNLRSNPSVWIKVLSDMARVVANDARAVVDMSIDEGYQLAASGDTLQMTRQEQYETGPVQTAYRLSLLDNYGNDTVGRDLPAVAVVTMPISRTGNIGISGIDYAVYYYNGVEDINIGGSVDPVSGTITVSTRKTGIFKVKQVIRSPSFRIIKTVPRKIFTPNGDGVWEEFHIIYENPQAFNITDAKVFSLDGAEIGRLKQGTYSSNSLMWDGRNKDGEIANSGIYIYQFKAGDKYYNGTMVLAR